MEKLYYESAYQKEFTATVLACREGKKGFEIVLDRTAFFPEGGGQPADTGVLGGACVRDVHEKGDEIIHYTDRPLAVGETVRGEIDWERRFLHMQQHSGEHLVSGLIHKKFGYDNVGFHMGTDGVTIDFNGMIDWDELTEIEAQANAMIWQNLEVRTYFPPKEELDRLDYRSKKELTGDVRIVAIPGADVCACCGTHVRLTGEIGLVKFLSVIHYKGGVRILLLCGKRALEDYEAKRAQVQKISNLLSAKTGEVAAAAEKLKQENEALSGRLSELYRRLIEYRIEKLPAGGGRAFLIEDGFDGLRLRQTANRVLEEKKAGTVLVLSEAKDGEFLYVLGSQSEDVRPVSKELNRLLNGRGGGSAQMAQGTFFREREPLCAVLEENGFEAV